MWLLILIPIITGGGLAAQSAVNSRLRQVVGSPYLSSLVSFATGWLLLLIAMGATRQTFKITGTTITANPWWIWCGGLLGVVGMTAFILLFPVLGSVQTSILTICGQILMGVLIDQFGWLYSPQKVLTWQRTLGIVLLISGVILANYQKRSRLAAKTRARTGRRFLWQAFAVVTGMIMAVQASVNGHLGTVLHSSLYAVTISFTLSLTCLIAGLLVTRSSWQGLLALGPAVHQQWWIIIGGALGILYSFSSAWLVPILGTGEVVVFSLFGQLLFSTCIDQWGLFGAVIKPVSRQKVWGLLLLFLGVLLISWG